MSVRHRIGIDHIEGDFAVVTVEGGASLDLPLWLLPANAREGDMLNVEVDHPAGGRSRVVIERDEKATRARRDDAAARVARFAEADDGGDLAL